jgi:hypothetical protein
MVSKSPLRGVPWISLIAWNLILSEVYRYV